VEWRDGGENVASWFQVQVSSGENRMKKLMVFLTLGALVTGAAAAVMATQVIQRTPQELAQESVLIVEGKVTGVRSYWNDDHSKIFTETTVAVASTYKGSGGTSG
jgi:hypothetical protein